RWVAGRAEGGFRARVRIRLSAGVLPTSQEPIPVSEHQGQQPDRNLAMELVRATEAAAMAAGRWMGRNQKEAGDQAAVDAMRLMLSSVQMDGVVIIGEGEKDEAPMLYNGENVGTGEPPGL